MIVRYNPTIDQAFEQLTRSLFDPAPRGSGSTGPAIAASWHDDQYVLTVDLPGVPADAVSVNVVGDQLHIGVNTDELNFERKLRLNNKLDGDKVTARHVDGRLTVKIGQVDEPEARSVEIDTSPQTPAIEAAADEAEGDADAES